ncbi:hypothetical protein DM860_011007 [Cuscuta australis]|uniref:NAC-A/B domain-containing protein n=1 Tax=Cuscuta australis TaxID=267555 RepID=A0A328E0J4_9ASTE|nr:hypothetical protein DM860_011007 [Cuscuta australis]
MAPGGSDAEKKVEQADPIVAGDEDYVLVNSEDDDEDEPGDDGNGNENSKQSKYERKTLKAMLKLGMKPVSDVVTRVAIKRSKNEFFIMSKPDVYKSTTSDRYVIIGEGREAKFGYPNPPLKSQVAHLVKLAGMVSDINKPKIISEASARAEEEEVDETRTKPRDVELVMSQLGVSRSKAVRALKSHDGDIVNAIFELTN